MAKQFSDVSGRFGAPMGRQADGFLETDLPRFVRLYRVRLDSGGYDDGGAYWGLGEPLWCAEDEDGNRKFIRASSRNRAALVLDIPDKALKRSLDGRGVPYGLALLDGRAPMPGGITRDQVIDWLQRSGACTFGREINQ